MSKSAVSPPLSKAERLAIGGAVAPVVRTARARPVVLVGKDGKPVGVTSTVEVAKSLLRRSEIEFSTQEGKRPEFVNCRDCGRPVRVGKSGPVPTFCRPGQARCECGKKLKPNGCPFGRKCMNCKGATEERFREALSRVDSYRRAGALLGISARAVFVRAKTLGIKPGVAKDPLKRAEDCRRGAERSNEVRRARAACDERAV